MLRVTPEHLATAPVNHLDEAGLAARAHSGCTSPRCVAGPPAAAGDNRGAGTGVMTARSAPTQHWRSGGGEQPPQGDFAPDGCSMVALDAARRRRTFVPENEPRVAIKLPRRFNLEPLEAIDPNRAQIDITTASSRATTRFSEEYQGFGADLGNGGKTPEKPGLQAVFPRHRTRSGR